MSGAERPSSVDIYFDFLSDSTMKRAIAEWGNPCVLAAHAEFEDLSLLGSVDII